MAGMIEHLQPGALSVGGRYSTAVRAGDFLYLSGQTPRDQQRNVIGATIEEQTEATLVRLEAILQTAGLNLAAVVKITVCLANLDDFPRFDKVYACHFPHVAPARTTLGCSLNGVLIELDAIAYCG